MSWLTCDLYKVVGGGRVGGIGGGDGNDTWKTFFFLLFPGKPEPSTDACLFYRSYPTFFVLSVLPSLSQAIYSLVFLHWNTILGCCSNAFHPLFLGRYGYFFRSTIAAPASEHRIGTWCVLLIGVEKPQASLMSQIFKKDSPFSIQLLLTSHLPTVSHSNYRPDHPESFTIVNHNCTHQNTSCTVLILRVFVISEEKDYIQE